VTDEAALAADDRDAPGDPAERSASGSSTGWLAWTIAAILAVLLAWVWLGLYAPVQRDQARQDAAEDATINFLSQLTNWDASDGLSATQDALLELGTEGFRSEVGAVFESMDDLVAQQTVSSGIIEDLFVQRVEGELAVLFGVVEQTFTTNTPGEPSVVRRSFRATLVEADGAWLVQRLELVGEEQVSGATPGVPNIGSDGESDPSVTESDASSPPIDNTGDPTEGETS